MLKQSKNEEAEAFSESCDIPHSAEDDSLKNQNFTLKIQDGILVVFNEADNLRPFIVTDIYASTLRHADREMLESGIVANGEVELLTLLEDFSS